MSLTRDQAEAAVGQKVIYRVPGVAGQWLTEEGVITSVNDRGAFVRYGADSTSKHTRFDDLELLAVSRG